MKTRLAAFGLVACVFAGAAWANGPGSSTEADVHQLKQALEEQSALIEALKQRVEDLEAETQETQAGVTATREQLQEIQEAVPERHPTDFRVYWKEGLNFATEDKQFTLKIGGRIQNDWAFFEHDDEYKIIGQYYPQYGLGDEQDGTEFRRARLYVSGSVYDNISFKAQYDFAANSPGDDAGKFKDVWLAIDDLPAVGQLKIGHFKEPFSLEELTSSKYITFMERALPNAFAPSRNVGVQISNTAAEERFRWALGAFKETDDWPSDNDSDEDQGWAVTARLSGLPWYADDGRKLLHLGLGYSHRNPDGNIRYRERPEAHLANRYVNTDRFRADAVDLWNAEAALVVGPWSLQGEYMMSDVDSTLGGDLDFDGYYVQTSYFLTGEHRPYKAAEGAFSRVKPKRNFKIGDNGGPGAWELALRYSHIDLNDGQAIRGGEESNITAGVNWYLNPNTRFMFNYVHADIDHDLWSEDLNVFQTRFQIDF